MNNFGAIRSDGAYEAVRTFQVCVVVFP